MVIAQRFPTDFKETFEVAIVHQRFLVSVTYCQSLCILGHCGAIEIVLLLLLLLLLAVLYNERLGEAEHFK